MTQKSIKLFVHENYSEGPKRYYTTKNTDVYNIDDIWSLQNLDPKVYGPEKQ